MSAATDIRDAVVTIIRAAGVTSPALDATNVRHRKVPQRFETDPNPLCLVVLGNQWDVSRNNMEVFRAYEVLVVVGRKGALVKAQSDDWMETTEQTLYEKLYIQRLLGDDGVVWKSSVRKNPTFNRQGWPKDFDLSGQLFCYETEELRHD